MVFSYSIRLMTLLKKKLPIMGRKENSPAIQLMEKMVMITYTDAQAAAHTSAVSLMADRALSKAWEDAFV